MTFGAEGLAVLDDQAERAETAVARHAMGRERVPVAAAAAAFAAAAQPPWQCPFDSLPKRHARGRQCIARADFAEAASVQRRERRRGRFDVLPLRTLVLIRVHSVPIRSSELCCQRSLPADTTPWGCEVSDSVLQFTCGASAFPIGMTVTTSQTTLAGTIVVSQAQQVAVVLTAPGPSKRDRLRRGTARHAGGAVQFRRNACLAFAGP